MDTCVTLRRFDSAGINPSCPISMHLHHMHAVLPLNPQPSAQSPTQLLCMARRPQDYVPQLTGKLARHEGRLLHGGQEATGLLCNHLVPQATLAVGAGGGVEVGAVQQRLHHFIGHHLVLLLALHTLCRLQR